MLFSRNEIGKCEGTPSDDSDTEEAKRAVSPLRQRFGEI